MNINPDLCLVEIEDIFIVILIFDLLKEMISK